jgi:hypothetical protein
MVRALLDGSKTQTRRVVKPQPDFESAREILGGDAGTATIAYDHMFGGLGLRRNAVIAFCQPNIHCPYGQPGDRLWAKESYRLRRESLQGAPMDGVAPSLFCDSTRWFEADGKAPELFGKLRASIHMPRWASRILLEIVSVRVERLQDISEADCWAEGIDACDGLLDDMKIFEAAKRMGRTFEDAAPTYAALWESINGVGSWDANPWVWVVEFKRVQP